MSDPKIPDRDGPIKRVEKKLNINFRIATRYQVLKQVRTRSLPVQEIYGNLENFFPFTKKDLAVPSGGNENHSVVRHRISNILSEMKKHGMLLQESRNSPYSISNLGKKTIDKHAEFDGEKFNQSYLKFKMPKNSSTSEEASKHEAAPPDSFHTLPPVANVDSIRSEILKNFFIEKDTLVTILAHLIAKKNILLTGPVGSGKTYLAKNLPRIAWREHSNGYYTKVYTATADWTTQDVIGGIYPKVNREKSGQITYEIQHGCVSETVMDNLEKGKNRFIDGTQYRGIWLVIDEFNRANIDRAFGQLFTALEYGELKIPTVESEESHDTEKIPDDYRIIGTLNTADRHFLYTLSDALKRRFAIVEIHPPKDWRIELAYALRKFWKDEPDSLDVLAQDLITKGTAEVLKHENVTEAKNIPQLRDIPETVRLIKTIETAIENNSDKDQFMMWRSILRLRKILSYIRANKPLGTELLISMLRFMLVRQSMEHDWKKGIDLALKTVILPQLEFMPYQTLEVMNAVLGDKNKESVLEALFGKTDMEYKSAVNYLVNYAGDKSEQPVSSERLEYVSNWVRKWDTDISGQIPEFCRGIDLIIREQNPYYEEEQLDI